MLTQHLLNASEFCVHPWNASASGCLYGLPSIARSDSAFGGSYWRGRIWGPMVQLVYWGLQRYPTVTGIDAARTALVEQSRQLLLKEWRELGHIHENYDPNLGVGCNVPNSDPFYVSLVVRVVLSLVASSRNGGCVRVQHWGALTVFIGLQEAGYYTYAAP